LKHRRGEGEDVSAENEVSRKYLVVTIFLREINGTQR